MPRPKKWRKVCSMPENTEFAPVGARFQPSDAVSMTVEEYEAIRLIDHEGLTQEECAVYMQIARTTVQSIYNEARKKLAVVLVEGKPLIISGGKYQLCEGNEPHCGHGGGRRQRCRRMNNCQASNGNVDSISNE